MGVIVMVVVVVVMIVLVVVFVFLYFICLKKVQCIVSNVAIWQSMNNNLKI